MGSIIKNLAIAIAVIGVLYVGYSAFFQSSPELSVTSDSNEGQLLANEFLIRLHEIEAISFPRDLFDDARFRSLVSFSTAPEDVAAGRPNPFSR